MTFSTIYVWNAKYAFIVWIWSNRLHLLVFASVAFKTNWRGHLVIYQCRDIYHKVYFANLLQFVWITIYVVKILKQTECGVIEFELSTYTLTIFGQIEMYVLVLYHIFLATSPDCLLLSILSFPNWIIYNTGCLCLLFLSDLFLVYRTWREKALMAFKYL